MPLTADRIVGIQTSTGEKKAVKLGGNLAIVGGVLDTVSDQFISLTNANAGAIAKGDAVYKNATNDQVDLADASVLSTAKVFGLVADASIATTVSGNIQSGGAMVGAGSFTAGDDIFLSITGTTGNTLSSTPPSADNEVIIKVGVAINATDLQIAIGEPIEL